MKKLFNKIKNKRAFTLIELLATITIIAIIAIIVIPSVSGIIENSKKKGFIESIRNSMSSIKDELGTVDEEFPISGIDAKTGLTTEKNPFIAGKFILGAKHSILAVRVSDGVYCANGPKEQIELVKGPCYLLDKTEPLANLQSGLITSKSIQVIMDASDLESEIISYEYSKDGGKTFSDSKENTFTFNNLSKDTSFNIVVKVTNENSLVTIKNITLKTLNFQAPTFTSNPGLTTWSQSKVVTINYPPRQSNLTYQYSLNNGSTWINVDSGTSKNVDFTSNGNLVARVTDGYNTEISTVLTLTTIDTTPPVCTVSGGTTQLMTSTQTIKSICTDSGGSGCNESTTETKSFENANYTYTPKNISDYAGNSASCPGVRIYVNTTDYVVNFVNGRGTTYSTQTVKYGGTASAPVVSNEDSYLWNGNWDRGYSNVTSNITVTAQFENLNAGISYGACFNSCGSSWQYSSIVSPNQAYYGNQPLTDFTFASPYGISLLVHTGNTGWNCTNCRWRNYPAYNGYAQTSSANPPSQQIQAIRFALTDSRISSTHKFCCAAYYNNAWHPAEAGNSTSSPGQCGTTGQSINLTGFKFYFKLKSHSC